MRVFRAHVLSLLLGIIFWANPARGLSYNQVVLADNPVVFLALDTPLGSKTEPDKTGRGHLGRYFPITNPPKKTRLQNGERATLFDGVSQYLEVKSASDLSVPANGALTIEAWIRPDVSDFPSDESDGYVHFLGKGESGEHEYALRMYSLNNSAGRPNRISAYVFNLNGGLGSGSYFQDPVTIRRWIYVTTIIKTSANPPVIEIYKNGVLRKSTPLSQFNVSPQPGSAPLRVGTRDLGSFFKGAMAKVAIYRYALSPTQLHKHYMEIAKWR